MTHDAALSLIDNGRLVFCHEMEKINNNSRHAEFCLTLEDVKEVLRSYGYQFEEIDRFVIDGWDRWQAHNLGIQRQSRAREFVIRSETGEDLHIHELAEYGRLIAKNTDILEAKQFTVAAPSFEYQSFMHISSHFASAYCCSPFAANCENSYVLIWDGGMPPQLFYFDCEKNEVRNLGQLFYLMGYIYITYACEFEPFSSGRNDLSVAGKVMAYIAKGEVLPELLEKLKSIYSSLVRDVGDIEMRIEIVAVITDEFVKRAKALCLRSNIPHRHMLASFHAFLQGLILEELDQKLKNEPVSNRNLCFAGGSALNIKWNQQLRKSGLFHEVWVPPMPNDSGSALGAACAEMLRSTGIRALDWSIYTGPMVKETNLSDKIYLERVCSVQELAQVLHKYNQPVVVLNGRAEIGPRALGNRSILAPANSQEIKAQLNQIKNRESYRPVAPICLEEDAEDVFDPGSPDPYMLFEHRVRPNWIHKVPAICHLDGTARLQTVNADQNKVIHTLLVEYKKISGIPLLCNTSANFKGRGFFPDVASVMQWEGVNFIWSNGYLFTKKTFQQDEVLSNHHSPITTSVDGLTKTHEDLST